MRLTERNNMADKELATRDIQLPKAIDSSQYGVNLGEEDQVMPRLILLQPTSKIEGAGKFYLSLTGELFETVECVVFSNARGRVMFDPDMTAERSICGSDDRIVPSLRYEKPQADRCANCSYSNRNYKTQVMVGGRQVDQYCSETQTLRCMFVDSLYPFLFVGRRTSLMPVNEFLSIQQFECAKHQKPLCCFPIRLHSALVSKNMRKYYIPRIERLGMIEREEFIAMMNKYANYDVNKTYEAEEKVGAEIEGVPEETPF